MRWSPSREETSSPPPGGPDKYLYTEIFHWAQRREGSWPRRRRAQGELRRGRRKGPPACDVRIFRGRALLQVQRLEAELDDPHAVRSAARQDEHGRPAPALRGPRPRVVREPPPTGPRRPHQVPQDDVREGRDLQSVNPRGKELSSVIRGREPISSPPENLVGRGRPPARRLPDSPGGRRRVRVDRLAPPHPQDASPPRPELGMPPLRGHERSGADGLLVLWGGDRPPRRASLGRADRGNVAVPQMPRMEQRLPPILLVVRDHPGEGAEAGCVTRPSGCRGTIRHRSG